MGVLLYLPRYAAPKRCGGIVPPSPPAEVRTRHDRTLLREARTYRGRLPVLMPGYEEERRVVLPGAPGYMEALRHSCMPYGSVCVPNATTLSSFPSGAVAHWSFENTSWLDSTSDGYTLTATNSPTVGAGQLGNAAYFTQSSSMRLSVALSSASNLVMSSNSYTLTGWIYTSDHSGQTFFGTSFDYYVWYDGSNNVLKWFTVAGSGVGTGGVNVQLAGNNVLTVSTWHFLCVGQDNPNAQSFGSLDNGSVLTTACTNNRGRVSTDHFYVGGNPDGLNTYTNGRIDSLTAWRRKLSGTEITNVFNQSSEPTSF